MDGIDNKRMKWSEKTINAITRPFAKWNTFYPYLETGMSSISLFSVMHGVLKVINGNWCKKKHFKLHGLY